MCNLVYLHEQGFKKGAAGLTGLRVSWQSGRSHALDRPRDLAMTGKNRDKTELNRIFKNEMSCFSAALTCTGPLVTQSASTTYAIIRLAPASMKQTLEATA